MTITIESFEMTRFAFKRDRVIGDAQVRYDMNYLGVLELHDSAGHVGAGFFGSSAMPLPAVDAIKQTFESQFNAQLRGHNPAALLNRLTRPRGGNRRPEPFAQPINQALWDLQGKILDLPLYKLLGGTENKVPAYASGLGFNLTDEEIADFFGQAATMGFSGFKVKVGHPTLEWDLNRLNVVRRAVGKDAILMVDANETWSPKEAIRRIHAYRDAGFDIYWLEDPCMRDDFEGLRHVVEAVPFTHINTGEYLDLGGKRRLMESGGADILNVHGVISDSMKAAWLASEYGIPVSLGNTSFEIGVHIACALPEVIWMEYSFHNSRHLLKEPVVFKDGWGFAPERPGHGLEISDEARLKLACPNVNDVASIVPPGPIQIRVGGA